MKQFKKTLAILLVVSLGTVVACGNDSKDDKNNNANNAAVNNNNPDTGNNDSDTENNDSDTGNNGGDDTKQLKDLSAAELSALCTQINTQEAVLIDPKSEYGKANCLIEAADIGYEYGEDDAEALEICEEVQVECQADEVEIMDECLADATDCTATVAEFEKCSLDYIAAGKALLEKFNGKTCTDYSSEEGIHEMDELFDTYVYPASCEALETKCPTLFGDPAADGE